MLENPIFTSSRNFGSRIDNFCSEFSASGHLFDRGAHLGFAPLERIFEGVLFRKDMIIPFNFSLHIFPLAIDHHH